MLALALLLLLLLLFLLEEQRREQASASSTSLPAVASGERRGGKRGEFLSLPLSSLSANVRADEERAYQALPNTWIKKSARKDNRGENVERMRKTQCSPPASYFLADREGKRKKVSTSQKKKKKRG